MEATGSPDFRSTAILCLRLANDLRVLDALKVRLNDPDFDWSGFQQYAQLEKIAPLIYHTLNGLGLLPENVAHSMHGVYLRNAWINSRRLEELSQLHKCFEAADIPAVILKGAALLVTDYQKIAFRPMVDVDILVKGEHFGRAKEAMASLSYIPEVGFTAWLNKDIVTEVHYAKAGQPELRVDLHSSLFTPPHLLTGQQIDWFWKHSVMVENKGICLRVFDPMAQMLHLCSHHLYHQITFHDGDLLKFNDIALVTQNNEMDWRGLLEAAKWLDMVIPLQRILPELASQWHISVPWEMLQTLSQMRPTKREQRMHSALVSMQEDYLRGFFTSIRSFSDWSRRLRFAYYAIFPSPQYIKDRYYVRNPFQIPFYYLYRLFSRARQQAENQLHFGDWFREKPQSD